jgi:hypothetical protein
MRWSVSGSRVFLQCPRKWFFGSMFANSRCKDRNRKEAHRLKQLQSVHSWRGKLVDQVISEFIVPKLNRHENVDLVEVMARADTLFESQLRYAKSHLGQTPETNGAESSSDVQCSLFELEYNGELDQGLIDRAREEVRVSLSNLLSSRLMTDVTANGVYLVAQRTLQFRFANVSVSCTPDLIAFFPNRPPSIVDWKVQAPKHKEHWTQLGVYGVALSRATPHKDFPDSSRPHLVDPTKIGIVEFQLLRNQEIQYSLMQDDIVDIEDYIYTTSNRMLRMMNGSDTSEIRIGLLPTTTFPETCMRCQFRKICWEGQAS